MEGIDLLKQLQKDQSRLQGRYSKMQKRLNERLTSFIEKLRYKEGLEILPIEADISKSWGAYKEESSFEVTFSVYFKDPSGATYSNGMPKRDFASDFTIEVFENKIKLNHGCCGYFDKQNKGQISRLHLMPLLFDREEVLIKLVKDNIDMSLYDELNKVDQQIEDINYQIKKAEQDRKDQATLIQLKEAKYLCSRRIKDKYEYDEKTGKQKYVGKYIVYYGYEPIVKITDKTVITKDAYFACDTHRHPLDVILRSIQQEVLFLQKEKIDEVPFPEGTEVLHTC